MESSTDLASKIERFRNLKRKNIEAARVNHKAVIEEDRVNKLPPNYAQKQERLEKKRKLEEMKLESRRSGIDFERVQNLDYTAEECDRWYRRTRKSGNEKQPFDYEDFTVRQYNKCANKFRASVDMEQYELMKAKMRPADFYPTRESFIRTLHEPSKEDIERLSGELNKQAMRRVKALVRRRGTHDPNLADIDYINEKNRLFNETVERFFGKYTTEIKQNLERGTAV